MRPDTQRWLAGTIVVSIALASAVVLHQRDQISQQQQAIDQQSQQARALKASGDEAERLRRQEETFALQLRTLDAEQARNSATAAADRASQAVSEQRAQDRQRLEGQIQDLKSQRVKLAHLAECQQTEANLKVAERASDSGQARALQERWNANCAGG